MAREFFTDIDLNQNEMQFMVMHPLASAPSGGTEVEGQMYYDTVAQQPFFWNGASWTSMSSGAASSVPFSGITGGTNTSATMLVGGGASLSFSGLGTINANVLDGRAVDAPAAQDGEFLVFEGGSTNAWVARSIIASDFPELQIDDLGDVVITSVADNEVLAFNNGTGQWINQTAAEAGLATASHTHTASDVTDFSEAVDDRAAALIQDGTGLSWTYDDGSNTLTGNVSLAIDDLSDVTITSVGLNEILQWTGVLWINRTFAEAGISAVGHTHTASDVTDFSEAVDDRAAALIQDGTGLSWTYDDGSNTLTGNVSLDAFSINDLSDVDINVATDGDLLQYIGGSINAWGPIPASSISADLGDAVILDPSSSARNVISNTDNGSYALLTLEAGNSGTYDLLVINNSSGAEMFTVDSAGDTVIRGSVQGHGSAGTADSTGFILDNSGIGGGPRTFTFPNSSGVLMTTNSAQTVTGSKTFNSGDLIVGSSASNRWIITSSKTGSDNLALPFLSDNVTMLVTADISITANEFAVANSSILGDVTFRSIVSSDIDNLISLNDLTDVDYSGGGPSDGDLLVYLGGSVDAWVHRSPDSILGDLSYVTGGGTAGEVTYWDGENSITSEAAFTYDAASNDLTVTSGNIITSRFHSAGGSAGSPSFTFSSDSDTGIYQAGSDSIGISAGALAGIVVTEAASAIVTELRDEIQITDGTNYVGFSLPALGGNTDYTLPAAAASSNSQVLGSTTAGVLSWISISSIDGADTDFASQYVSVEPSNAVRNVIVSQATGAIGLKIVGASGQSANNLEIQANGGANLFTVDPSGNVTIAGDLTISGTTTTVDTTNLIVEDNFIVVNSAGVAQDAGIEVERGGAGSNDNAFLRFSESNNEWYVDNGTVSHFMARKYVEEITGDSSTTTFNILHDMGSLYVLVQVFDSSTGKQVEIDVDVFSSDRVDLNFKAAPSGGQSYRVIVVG